jgi:hypothetical protein
MRMGRGETLKSWPFLAYDELPQGGVVEYCPNLDRSHTTWWISLGCPVGNCWFGVA